MPRITVGTENKAPIEIHYEDHGSGDPVVMVHGYPLNGNSWERQERELLAEGFRVITYDRRGFGRSSQPTVGYDYNTFAADLSDLLEQLDLRNVVLVGFSMGSGEVTRYLGTYGSSRVRKAALLAAIPPFLLKTDDNPEGVDRQVFEEIKAAIAKDRYAYFKDFLDNFYNVDKLMPDRISESAWQASFAVAAGCSPFATYACVDTWLTDFRRDLPKIDVPVLIVHGTEDRILPYEATAARLPALLDDVKLVAIDAGPHNIAWTHPDEVNRALLEFLHAPAPAVAAIGAELRHRHSQTPRGLGRQCLSATLPRSQSTSPRERSTSTRGSSGSPTRTTGPVPRATTAQVCTPTSTVAAWSTSSRSAAT